ncbi:MAG: hypothetical protein V4580_03995 [Bacteroidota bacterium]
MKKYIILFVSLILLNPVKVANGCGFSLMPEEYRVYLFNQSALNRNELLPLFYSTEYFYNQSGYYYDRNLTEFDETYSPNELANAKEWKEQTKYKGPVNDIVSVVYHLDINSVILHADSTVKQHPFLKHLVRTRKQEYNYLVYAKKCELIYEETDPWGLKPDNNIYLRELEKEGKAQVDKKINPFLQLRYAYQLLKISFYHPGIGNSVEDIYNQYIKTSKQNTWLKASAQFYVYQSVGFSSEEFQYHLSLSFDETIDKKFRCVQLFNRKHYLQTLKKAKNDHQRAIIYVMYELQNPARSLTNLKKIYQLDARNEYLSFLIAREINKIEDWLLTPELTSMQPAIMEYQYRDDDSLARLINIKSLSNKKYLFEMYAFVNDLIKISTSDKLSEYHVLASNLCILLHQKEKGLNHLLLAETNNKSMQLTYQITFNKIALQMDGNTLLTEPLRQQILNFVAFNKQYPALVVHQQTSLHQLYLYIGSRLIQANDVANGILFCSKTERPLGEIGYWKTKSYLELLLEKAKPRHYDDIISLIDKPRKTLFEKFLLDRSEFASQDNYYGYPDSARVTKNKILDYKSMYYVQQDMLDSALKCVTQIDARYWTEYPYNLFKCFPFISGNAVDYQSNNDFYAYNKRQYLQRMVDVKYLIDNQIGDVSKHYFVLANGYFNMSYHGNYWIMNMPYKLSDEMDNGFYNFSSTTKKFLDNYYGCQQAEQYFLKAFESTKDTALAAICISKASLCNNNLQTLNWRLNNSFDRKKYEWTKELKIIPDKYKHLFLNKYKHKDFYEDFVSNCYHYKHVNSYYY